MKRPATPCARRAGNVVALEYAVAAAARALEPGLQHGDAAKSFTRRALFVVARQADAGAATACALLRSIMSWRIYHRGEGGRAIRL